MKKIYAASLFVDSGAHSLYNLHVLKMMKREGEHGRLLEKPSVAWGGTDPKTDFSYYDLTKGSPFRAYCDDYASFMKKMEPYGILLANIDAIGNPDLTWEIQRFFEEEHGVHPMPIVHCHTPMKYVDRYLEHGRYDLMGVGGLGQGISRQEYYAWGDKFFFHICPESNKRLPVIKTHGFAMTSWDLICRWPWWSVDSATWVKLSAYGWIYCPRWCEKNGFRFDRTPRSINFSFRSPQKRNKGKHYENVSPRVKLEVDKWIEHLGLPMGSVDGDGKIVEFGISSHHRARSIANLKYLKELEMSRPKWPWPLRSEIIHGFSVDYRKGFGL